MLGLLGLLKGPDIDVKMWILSFDSLRLSFNDGSLTGDAFEMWIVLLFVTVSQWSYSTELPPLPNTVERDWPKTAANCSLTQVMLPRPARLPPTAQDQDSSVQLGLAPGILAMYVLNKTS